MKEQYFNQTVNHISEARVGLNIFHEMGLSSNSVHGTILGFLWSLMNYRLGATLSLQESTFEASDQSGDGGFFL